jgi:hypothetical protein
MIMAAVMITPYHNMSNPKIVRATRLEGTGIKTSCYCTAVFLRKSEFLFIAQNRSKLCFAGTGPDAQASAPLRASALRFKTRPAGGRPLCFSVYHEPRRRSILDDLR